jgi:hypothetical protein
MELREKERRIPSELIDCQDVVAEDSGRASQSVNIDDIG